MQQLEVEHGAEAGVVEPRFSRPHGILPTTKLRQSVRDEIVQGRLGFGCGQGPVEGRHGAGVGAESLLDHCQDFLGQRIRGKPARRGHETGALFPKRFPVFGVVIPLATGRLIPVHQEPGPLAQFAVEELQAQLLASSGVSGEILGGAEKMLIGSGHPGDARGSGDFLQLFLQAPLSGIHCMDFCRTQSIEREGQLASQGLRTCGEPKVGSVTKAPLRTGDVQLPIGYRPTPLAKPVAKVAHGRQKNRNPALGVPHMRGFARDLGHPDPVELRLETLEHCGIGVQLVSQHHDEPSAGGDWSC